MKRSNFFLTALLFLGTVLLSTVFGFFFWRSSLQAVSPGSKLTTSFVITKQETASDIITRLANLHLIKSPFVAKAYLKLTGTDSKLKPGGYVLSPHLTLPETVALMVAGPKDVWVTFPEGWRREQFAARLHSTFPQFDTAEFLKLSQDQEGFLFPDTYLLPAEGSPSAILSILTTNFVKKTGLKPTETRVIPIAPASHSLSAHATATLASLVEREAKTSPDRLLVAGILINRLREGWALQIDATVQYAADSTKCQPIPLDCDYWQPITSTQFSSPYNTYLHPGLPPAPIANPGLASITAVLAPTSSPYRYYLTDANGITHFASTLDQHNLNVDKYLRN